MKRLLGLIGSLLLLTQVVTAQTLPVHKQVGELMQELLSKVPVTYTSQNLRLYIQPPVYLAEDGNGETTGFIGSRFARHLRAMCEASLQPPFVLIPRDDLDKLWSEVELAQVTVSHNPDQVQSQLQSLVSQQVILPLDAILLAEYGEWNDDPQTIQLNLYLLLVNQVQKYTAVGTLRLTKAQSLDAPVRPDDYERLQQQTQQLSHVIRDEVVEARIPEDALFDLFVTVDRGAGAVYEEDEALTIRVSSEIDCYIRVTNVDSTGQVHQLFPNAYESDNFVRAGQGRQIPTPGTQNYDLAIGAPFGLETIKVVASHTPFPADTALQGNKGIQAVPFPQLGIQVGEGVDKLRNWAKAVIVREKENVRLAEAQCVFMTMPHPSKGIWGVPTSRSVLEISILE